MPTSGEWIQPIDITVPPNLTTLYVPASVDDIAPAIRQVGAWVTEIESADQLLSVDLSKVTTVAIGARAFDVHPELLGQAGRLLEFVRNGGTLVVLRGDEATSRIALFPYPLVVVAAGRRACDATGCADHGSGSERASAQLAEQDRAQPTGTSGSASERN